MEKFVKHKVVWSATDSKLSPIDKIFYTMLNKLEQPYKDQTAIAEAVNIKYADFKTKFNQSSVSKAMRHMMIEIDYHDELYGFTRELDGYRLIKYTTAKRRFELTKQELIDKAILVKGEMCKVSDTVYVYKLVRSANEEKMYERFEMAWNYFYRLMGSDLIFEITMYGDLLIVMLKKIKQDWRDYSTELEELWNI